MVFSLGADWRCYPSRHNVLSLGAERGYYSSSHNVFSLRADWRCYPSRHNVFSLGADSGCYCMKCTSNKAQQIISDLSLICVVYSVADIISFA